MKKLTAILVLCTTFCASALAYRIDFSMYDFQNENGDLMGDNGSFAILVGKSGVDFSDFVLEDGDSFIKDEWFNSDEASGIYVMDVGSLVDSMAGGTINVNFDDYSAMGFTGAEEIAVIAFDTDETSYTINLVEGDKYTVFTPSMNGGNSGSTSSDNWELYTSGDAYNLVMLTQNQGGTLPDSFAQLSQTVAAVPEASTCAAIFGALALGLALIRRKK